MITRRFVVNGVPINVEYDSKEDYGIRLVMPEHFDCEFFKHSEQVTPWYRSYASLATIVTYVGLVAYASEYWEGILPTEVPFLITRAKERKDEVQ